MTNANELLEDLHSQPDLSRGLCVGDPELWGDPDDPGLVDRAIELCMSCPVYSACRGWVETLPPNTVHGVLGGRVFEWLSPEQQRRRKRRAA